MRQFFIAALLFVGAWQGLQYFHYKERTGTGSLSAEQVTTLAAAVKAGDVVMYSTTECGYCVEAKAWLTRYGFVFRECNMSDSAVCAKEFRQLGGIGTPFLVVRGRSMKDGFDVEEFFGALKQTDGAS